MTDFNLVLSSFARIASANRVPNGDAIATPSRFLLKIPPCKNWMLNLHRCRSLHKLFIGKPKFSHVVHTMKLMVFNKSTFTKSDSTSSEEIILSPMLESLILCMKSNVSQTMYSQFLSDWFKYPRYPAVVLDEAVFSVCGSWGVPHNLGTVELVGIN